MSTSENENEMDGTEEQEMNVRILIQNRQVGSIIGKKGARIQNIRDQVGSPFLMNILKPESKVVQERILALRGTVTQVSKAIQLVSELILKGAPGLGTENQETDCMDNLGDPDIEGKELAIKLLVHKFVVGSIIGKAGSMIQGIQTDTGTKVQISTDPLPNSTEKTVTVTGTPNNIHEAAFRILSQLQSYPVREGTKVERYRPGVPGFGQQMPFGAPPFMGGAPHQQQSYYGMSPNFGNNNTSRPSSTQKIMIPTICAGSVIGRGGNNIRNLKAQTGCTISILDADANNPDERVVVLTGPSSGIHQAIYLITNIVDQYQTPSAY